MLAIVDERTPQTICDSLEARGYSLLRLPPHPDLPTPIASHPDMLLFFAKDRILCTKQYAELAKRELEILSNQSEKPIVTVEERVSSDYPNDILFNCAVVGNSLFCHASHTAKAIAEDPNYNIHFVRQGYAKCSTVPVAEKALITEDPSIATVAKANGFDVLQIDPENVSLTGYNTGFFGGATSFSPYRNIREIYVCGNLEMHSNATEIIDFCSQYDRIPLSLSKDPLLDLGTVFLIS